MHTFETDDTSFDNTIYTALDALSGGSELKVVWVNVSDSQIVALDVHRKISFIAAQSDVSEMSWPIVSPDGSKIIFSTIHGAIYSVPWLDTGVAARTYLVQGFCPEAVWYDSSSDIDWLYYLTSERFIWRCDLAEPSKIQPVWTMTQADHPFSLSHDGAYGACQLPWPSCGVVELRNDRNRNAIPNGKFHIALNQGCNSNIFPDNSYRMFHVSAGTFAWKGVTYPNHAGIFMYDSLVHDKSAPYSFIPIPVDGLPVHKVRCTNNASCVTYFGPLSGKPRDVFLAEFDEQFTSLRHHVRIRLPGSDDASPYAWFAPQTVFASVDTLTFTFDSGTCTPDNRLCVVGNSANAATVYSAVADEPWVDCILSGNVVTVSVVCAGVACGVTTAKIRLCAPGFRPTAFYVRRVINGCTPHLNSVAIRPASAVVTAGGSFAFRATPFDQFGEALYQPVGPLLFAQHRLINLVRLCINR